MAVIASDDWTGTNGDPWNAAKWINQDTTSSSSIDIQGNKGRMNPAGASYASAYTSYDVADQDDFEAVFSWELEGVSEQYQKFYFRNTDPTDPLMTAGPRSSYFVEIEPATDQITLYRSNGSAGQSNLSRVTSAGINDTDKRWMRVSAVGSALKVRWWDDGDPEPGTWQIEHADATYSSGAIGFMGFNGVATAARPIFFDDFSVDNLAAAAVEGDAQLDADATVGGSATVERHADAQLDADATVSVEAHVGRNADAQLDADATVSVEAHVGRNASADLDGTATLSGDTETSGTVTADAQLSGTATVTVAAHIGRNADAELDATATMFAEAAIAGIVTADAQLLATATLTGSAGTSPSIIFAAWLVNEWRMQLAADNWRMAVTTT